MRAVVLVGAIVIAASPLAAQESLSGEALRQAVAGKTVHLDTPVGALPLVYGANGSLRGLGGTIAGYFAGPKEDRGRWWVSSEKLCQRWNTWLDSQTQCYKLSRSGDRVHWVRDDGRSGTARISN
jgi:hypothetical protein